MKKSQIASILVEQTKRKNVIISLLLLVLFISILAFSLFFVFIRNKDNNYITYNEKSNVFYKVYLKENDFFEDNYLEGNKQYIASLIEKITADFEYALVFDSDNVDYKYEYEINANVKVYDKDTNNLLFSKTENLIEKTDFITSEKNISVKQSVEIDYNYFNDLIKKFVVVYDLDDAESVLTIDMGINTISSCEDFIENEKNKSVISLTIPLTTKTVAIEMSNDLIDTENNIMLCEENTSNNVILLLAILFLILDFVVIVWLINYEYKTRSVNTVYIKKLKKILNNYGAYIQEVTGDYAFQDYKVVKIGTFEDLLEIRDTIRQPILMKQNKENTCSYFIVPSNINQLYVYRLKVEEI